MSLLTSLPHALPMPLLDLSIQFGRSRPNNMASRRSSTHQMTRHRAWKPECQHLMMARAYHPSYQCNICRRGPQFGWMYCCTVDREALILKAKLKGEDVAFDQIGRAFAEQMSLGKHGPDSRTKKYAFLREITVAQLSTYTPEQLAIILSQRDNVAAATAKERRQYDNGVLGDVGRKFPGDKIPWMPDEAHECKYMVCQSCHAMGREKTWVSLNSVLNGDILPTVATGYSFSYSKSRPYIDAKLAENLGCRPVCFPTNHPVSVARRISSYWNLQDQVDSWSTGEDRFSTMVDITAENSDEDSLSDLSDGFFEDEEVASEQWAYFPDPQLEEFHHNNSALHKNSLDLDSNQPTEFFTNYIRPAWTPPPTPSNFTNEISGEWVRNDGRSPSSLKTNSMVRMRLFSSFPSINAVLQQGSEDDRRSEEKCDVERGLPVSNNVPDRACGVPLSRFGLAEEFSSAKRKIFSDDSAPSNNFGQDDSHQTVPAVARSPRARRAVALMTEESVEDGTPDLVLATEEEAETTC